MSIEDGTPLVSVGVDDINQIGRGSSFSSPITDNIYGFNHRQMASAIPINKDHYGFTFFTRPQLNLTTKNLRNVRLMTPLLASDSLSYQRAIRCILDPRLMQGYSNERFDGVSTLTCPLVDSEQAYIPLLTNNLISISGWPDITVPTFTAPDGLYKEAWSIVDGVTVNYTSFDLTATFRNSRGDPITTMFSYWSHYMANVFESTLLPYPDMIIRNEIDYNTRIYRLILDPSKKYVQRIAATGASFPIAVPVGSMFDYNSEKPYNDANAQISIPFKALGAIYADDMLVWAFNQTTKIFNASMRDQNRQAQMMKIPFEYLNVFNHRGYPYINPETYELEWWIKKDMYEEKKRSFQTIMSELNMDLI